MRIFHKKYPEIGLNLFFYEYHHMDNTNAQEYSKISHTQYCTMKAVPFPENQVFLKINLHGYFLFKFQKNTTFWVQRYFSIPTILETNGPSTSEHPNIFSIPFNSRSNIAVILVHWNSLHSKKTYLFRTKTRTYNLHHRKAWSAAVILSLMLGVQLKQKK